MNESGQQDGPVFHYSREQALKPRSPVCVRTWKKTNDFSIYF